jgi:hypothetical protein
MILVNNTSSLDISQFYAIIILVLDLVPFLLSRNNILHQKNEKTSLQV